MSDPSDRSDPTAATPQPPRPAAAANRINPAERILRTPLKLRHLNLLVALDDTRKLHRAASQLNLSQPAASKMLGEIEKLVGVPLFERLARGVEPTGFGEALIRRTRTVLAELGQAGEEIAALKAGEGGTVSVGTVMAPAVEAVAVALERVRRRLPRLQVNVQVETSDVLSERLLASRIDFAIARIPAGADPGPFDYREVGEEEAGLIVREGHPLARLQVVRPADLHDRDWVLQPRGSLLRRSVESMLRRHGVPPPERVVNTASILMTTTMVANTDSIAPLALPVAELFLAAGRFRILPLTERITVEPYGLMRVKDRPLSPAARVLHAAVEEELFRTGGK